MSNTIVQEIHSSFTNAEADLLAEAKEILESADNEEKRERADQLARMGFTNAKPVEKMSKENQERAKTLLHLKSRYDRIAPQYKFLTERKLIEICEKYGIVVGSAERYTGDIPEENQEDLFNFKVLDKSFLEIADDDYRDARHNPRNGAPVHPKEMSTGHIFNTIKLYQRKLAGDHHRGQYMSRSDVSNFPVAAFRAMITELTLRGDTSTVNDLKESYHFTPLSNSQVEELFTPYKTTYFYVAADVDSFNTQGVTLENNMLVEQNNNKELEESIKDSLFREYDPIVLAKVQGGYLVVTAWGDEADDPDVIEPTRN